MRGKPRERERELVAPLRNGDKLRLETRSTGLFALSDLKHFFKKLGIDFTRFGMFRLFGFSGTNN